MAIPEYEAVRVSTIEDTAWSIELDGSVTVMEAAAIMAGIGCRTRAEPFGDGFRLVPLDAGAMRPTPEQLRDILQHGVSRLPSLVAIPICV